MVGNEDDWIGYCGKCNRVIMACVAMKGHEKDTAAYVSKGIRDGFKMERIDHGRLKEIGWCSCLRQKKTS